MFKKISFVSISLVLLLSFMTGCSSSPVATVETGAVPGEKLAVVATTTIVGDVVHNVGGDSIDLSVLLPVGMDPHSFQPTPQDMAKVADARMVVMNGAGLEEFMASLLENAGGQAVIVNASEGIHLMEASEIESHEEGEEHEHEAGDPHVWVDPNNVMVWVKNIETALSEADPANAALYRANAEAYIKSLHELDAWIREQIAQIPDANRDLVTDHQMLGYFAARYGFQQIGAIIPGYSTLAESSAQELADLEEAIRVLGVKAILVGNTVNPSLAERIAGDTNTRLVYILTGSLTETGGEADNYLDYIRYNVNAIVGALK